MEAHYWVTLNSPTPLNRDQPKYWTQSTLRTETGEYREYDWGLHPSMYDASKPGDEYIPLPNSCVMGTQYEWVWKGRSDCSQWMHPSPGGCKLRSDVVADIRATYALARRLLAEVEQVYEISRSKRSYLPEPRWLQNEFQVANFLRPQLWDIQRDILKALGYVSRLLLTDKDRWQSRKWSSEFVDEVLDARFIECPKCGVVINVLFEDVATLEHWLQHRVPVHYMWDPQVQGPWSPQSWLAKSCTPGVDPFLVNEPMNPPAQNFEIETWTTSWTQAGEVDVPKGKPHGKAKLRTFVQHEGQIREVLSKLKGRRLMGEFGGKRYQHPDGDIAVVDGSYEPDENEEFLAKPRPSSYLTKWLRAEELPDSTMESVRSWEEDEPQLTASGWLRRCDADEDEGPTQHEDSALSTSPALPTTPKIYDNGEGGMDADQSVSATTNVQAIISVITIFGDPKQIIRDGIRTRRRLAGDTSRSPDDEYVTRSSRRRGSSRSPRREGVERTRRPRSPVLLYCDVTVPSTSNAVSGSSASLHKPPPATETVMSPVVPSLLHRLGEVPTEVCSTDWPTRIRQRFSEALEPFALSELMELKGFSRPAVMTCATQGRLELGTRSAIHVHVWLEESQVPNLEEIMKECLARGMQFSMWTPVARLPNFVPSGSSRSRDAPPYLHSVDKDISTRRPTIVKFLARTSQMVILIYNDIALWRGELKKAAVIVIPPAYRRYLCPPSTVVGQAECHDYSKAGAEQLIKKARFLRGPIDEDGIYAQMSLGNTFLTKPWLSPLQRSDVFLTVSRPNGGAEFPSFTANVYRPLWVKFIKLLKKLSEDEIHADLLESLCCEIVREGHVSGCTNNVDNDLNIDGDSEFEVVLGQWPH
ncbi:hypothetical protein BJ138DRAFT_1106734 [Hygrophoropsis aurantiaca]|uniref:Uncharacterized protein n=1 Tax=Hygrophoropsis aurantiaca TaxID=72124 RepID=A0ACB7ZUL1_9AGAM|nr:hypothetical protein BJ138DRAFT_1106734 [Hygrophoropsis aurantiaca]